MVLDDSLGFIGEKPVLQVLFLKNDVEQSVEIEEVRDINFGDVMRRLERGESVFITQKRRRPPVLPKTKRKSNADWMTKQIVYDSRSHAKKRLYVART